MWNFDKFDLKSIHLKKNERSDFFLNLSYLCNEFMDYLYKDVKKSYSKADMMRNELNRYLVKRVNGEFKYKSKSNKRKDGSKNNLKNILYPDSSLDQQIAAFMDIFSFRLYRALALYESIPYWLSFLELNHLIDSPSSDEIYKSISYLYVDVEKLIVVEKPFDKFAKKELSSAWNK